MTESEASLLPCLQSSARAELDLVNKIRPHKENRMPETPYATVSVEKIDQVPPALRPDIRRTECAKCGSPVILYQPSFVKTQAIVKSLGRELVVMCPACIVEFETKSVAYCEVHSPDPQVVREFHRAAAELN